MHDDGSLPDVHAPDGARHMQSSLDVFLIFRPGRMTAERAGPQRQAAGNVLGAFDLETFLLERDDHRAQQGIITLARGGQQAGQQRQTFQVRNKSAEVRPVHDTGHAHRMTAGVLEQTKDPAELGQASLAARVFGQRRLGQTFEPHDIKRATCLQAFARHLDRQGSRARDEAELFHRLVVVPGLTERPRRIGADEFDDLHHFVDIDEHPRHVVQALLERTFIGEQQPEC